MLNGLAVLFRNNVISGAGCKRPVLLKTMIPILDIGNNTTSIILQLLLFLGSVFTGTMAYLTFLKSKKIERNTDGMVTTMLAGKEEESQAKQNLSEATGKAAGIAEKQIEIDKLNRESPAGSSLAKEDIVEKTKDAVKEKVEDIKPGDIVGKKPKK